MAKLKRLFEGIYSFDNKLLTENLVPGKKVYGEKLFEIEGKEYRVWEPFRSKLAAAIKKGLKKVPLEKKSVVLYLGSSEGTTASHVSDIIGKDGVLFGVEFSSRSMRKFVLLSEERQNFVPVLSDANKPEKYSDYLQDFEVDLLFQDIAQKNQAEIFNKNAAMFLKKGKYGLISIKARSIDSTKPAQELFNKEIEKLKSEFEIEQVVSLEPFEKDHVMVLCKKK